MPDKLYDYADYIKLRLVIKLYCSRQRTIMYSVEVHNGLYAVSYTHLPGKCCFPDMLDDKARQWFGDKYRILIDKGIDGFWNDMNETAIFYSEKHLKEVFEKMEDYKDVYKRQGNRKTG